MMKLLKSSRWLLLVSGILMVILGIVTLFVPAGSLVSLALFISIAVLISGISEIVAYFGEEKEFRSGWVLAGGILSALIGLWLMFGRGYVSLAMVIPFVFALWVIAAGTSRAVGSFSLKSAEYPGWGWVLVMGILELVSGFILLFSPMVSAVMTSILITVLFISHGIGNIVLFSSLTRIRNLFKWMAGSEKAKYIEQEV